MQLRLKNKLNYNKPKQSEDKSRNEQNSGSKKVRFFQQRRRRRPLWTVRRNGNAKNPSNELEYLDDENSDVLLDHVDFMQNSEKAESTIIDDSQRYLFSARSEMSILHTAFSEDRDLDPCVDQQPVSPSMTLQSVRSNRVRSLPPFTFAGENINIAPNSFKHNECSEKKWLALNDDPTAEESVECVFSHQLVNGDVHLEETDRHNLLITSQDNSFSSSFHLQKKNSPALISTVIKNVRLTSCDDFDSSCGTCFGTNEENHEIEKHYRSGRSHLGTYMPQIEDFKEEHDSEDFWSTRDLSLTTNHDSIEQSIKKVCCQSCLNGRNTLPSLSPSQWPQFPLLLRPTPGSRTRVKGVRFAKSNEYFSTDKTWWNSLQDSWKSDKTDTVKKKGQLQPVEFCPECCCIPINNGNEAQGDSLVVDFESPLFTGTLHMRIRGTNGSTKGAYDDSFGYFSGLNRHYQVVIRGFFKKEGIPLTECITGQVFRKPVKTPGPYVSKALVKVMNFFAPRLQAKLDGETPFILSPLGSTTQTITIDPLISSKDYKADATISDRLEEPAEVSRKLIRTKTTSSSSVGRAKARKKAFDRLCASGDKSRTFQTDKLYTFEFLQHLLDFQTFEMGLGSILGKHRIDKMLNGMCLNMMAAHQRSPAKGEVPKPNQMMINNCILDDLWSFDLWHANLLEKA